MCNQDFSNICPHEFAVYLTKRLQTKFSFCPQLQVEGFELGFECHLFVDNDIVYRILLNAENEKYNLIKVHLGEKVDKLVLSGDLPKVKEELSKDIFNTFYY
jgi:hypothetical protein